MEIPRSVTTMPPPTSVEVFMNSWKQISDAVDSVDECTAPTFISIDSSPVRMDWPDDRLTPFRTSELGSPPDRDESIHHGRETSAGGGRHPDSSHRRRRSHEAASSQGKASSAHGQIHDGDRQSAPGAIKAGVLNDRTRGRGGGYRRGRR